MFIIGGCSDIEREGKYLHAANPANQLELKPDYGFSLTQNGKTINGQYQWEESRLIFVTPSGRTTMGEMRGDTLIDGNNERWIKWRSGARGPAADPQSTGAVMNERVRRSNREAITLDLESLGADAYQYLIRPSAMGGGGGSYEGYAIDPAGQWGNANANAAYTVKEQTPYRLVLVGTSKVISDASVTATFDADGKNIGIQPSGWE